MCFYVCMDLSGVCGGGGGNEGRTMREERAKYFIAGPGMCHGASPWRKAVIGDGMRVASYASGEACWGQDLSLCSERSGLAAEWQALVSYDPSQARVEDLSDARESLHDPTPSYARWYRCSGLVSSLILRHLPIYSVSDRRRLVILCTGCVHLPADILRRLATITIGFHVHLFVIPIAARLLLACFYVNSLTSR